MSASKLVLYVILRSLAAPTPSFCMFLGPTCQLPSSGQEVVDVDQKMLATTISSVPGEASIEMGWEIIAADQTEMGDTKLASSPMKQYLGGSKT
jgi:hypothetical protein